MMETQSFDVIMIGAGAAGVFCAAEAGKRGRRVLVLEHNDKAGKKILISGGGRCNFTNLYSSPENFISQNPNFCRSALSRYTPQDFIRKVESHKITYYEKKLGQLFCTDSAQQITSMLIQECKQHRVKILYQCNIHTVEKPDRFRLETSLGTFESESLVIATGGLSIPTLGATDFGYRIAEQFGIKLTEIRPGLVPFTLSKADKQKFGDLSGISVDTITSCGGHEFHEKSLITHRGLSGPAILQISSYWKAGAPITINLLPDVDAAELFEKHGSENRLLKSLLEQYLPNRFAKFWCEHYAPDKMLPQYTKAEQDETVQQLHHWTLTPAGTEGYKKAEVTLGGIDTRELSPKTMESKQVAGLFFIGEVIDVTGHLGGHNFQWAWASAHAAGEVV